MKRLKTILFGASIFLLLFSGIVPQTKLFTFRIMQNGNEVSVHKNSVKLNKKPFVIEFTFFSPGGVLVNASFTDISFKIAKSKSSFGKIQGFKETGMAESDFNKYKEIIINDNAPNYWFYENEKSNRFDEVSTANGVITCKRTIQQLLSGITKEATKIEQVSKDLYLVLLVTQRGKSEEADKELQRECLVIKWN